MQGTENKVLESETDPNTEAFTPWYFTDYM